MTELTQELVKELFDYKDGILYWKKINGTSHMKIGDIAGGLHHTGYYHVGINNKRYSNHRLIFLYHYGYLPKEIDHIDSNRQNNNIKNLREVTRSQNQWNGKKRENTSSIYKGVSWYKRRNKWTAYINYNKKRINLGYFINEKDAAITYNIKAIELFKEFVNLNEV